MQTRAAPDVVHGVELRAVDDTACATLSQIDLLEFWACSCRWRFPSREAGDQFWLEVVCSVETDVPRNEGGVGML